MPAREERLRLRRGHCMHMYNQPTSNVVLHVGLPPAHPGLAKQHVLQHRCTATVAPVHVRSESHRVRRERSVGGLQNPMTSSGGRTSAETEGSRLPPRENTDRVGAPHQYSRAASRLPRALSTGRQRSNPHSIHAYRRSAHEHVYSCSICQRDAHRA